MQTLSRKIGFSELTDSRTESFTNIVSLVEYNDGIFGHLFRDLLGHLRVEQIMERINDNIYKRHLHLVGQFEAGHTLFEEKSYHSSNGEIRADSFITPELQDICQGPYSRWYQLPRFSLSQCLQYMLDSSKKGKKDRYLMPVTEFN